MEVLLTRNKRAFVAARTHRSMNTGSRGRVQPRGRQVVCVEGRPRDLVIRHRQAEIKRFARKATPAYAAA
jgi:hypothetical protein